MDPTLIVAPHVCLFVCCCLYLHVIICFTALSAIESLGCVRDSRFGRANDDAGIPLFGPLRLPPHIALDRPLFLSLSHLV